MAVLQKVGTKGVLLGSSLDRGLAPLRRCWKVQAESPPDWGQLCALARAGGASPHMEAPSEGRGGGGTRQEGGGTGGEGKGLLNLLIIRISWLPG